MEIRFSVTDAGHHGTHVFARVRNLNAHAVVLVANFRADIPAESDGYIPGEQWRLVLGPAETAAAEAIVLLGRSDIALASISRVERVMTASDVTVSPSRH